METVNRQAVDAKEVEVESEFLKLVNNPVFNVDGVERYSGVYQVKKETLSHHITDVSLLSYVLTLKLNTYGENLDKGIVLEKCLLHDMEEVLTGDIPRSTKYYCQEGLLAMQGVADDAMGVITELIDGSEDMMELWDNAKKGKEGVILKLADMLCVVRKVTMEVGLLNNNYFLKVATEVRDFLSELYVKVDLSEFKEPSKEYIRTLIMDAVDVLTDIIESHQYEYTKYGINHNLFTCNTKK